MVIQEFPQVMNLVLLILPNKLHVFSVSPFHVPLIKPPAALNKIQFVCELNEPWITPDIRKSRVGLPLAGLWHVWNYGLMCFFKFVPYKLRNKYGDTVTWHHISESLKQETFSIIINIWPFTGYKCSCEERCLDHHHHSPLCWDCLSCYSWQYLYFCW